ncbi:MAG: fibronectin type III domain-containing protein [Acidobacteria bacterium]|nr:fibronectin type III domain-containing protein [Acidobacteriota bacterium]
MELLSANGALILTWDEPLNVAEIKPTTYEAQYRRVGSASWMPWTGSGLGRRLNNLATGDQYRARVRAAAGNVRGPWAVVGPTTIERPDATIPGVPANVELSTPGGTLTLTWDEPGNAAEAPPTGYEAQYRKVGTAHWRHWTGTGLGRTLSGLTAGDEYRARVRAISGTATGLWALAGPVTIPDNTSIPGQPGPPTAIVGAGEVTVTWNPPEPLECCPITKWEVGYRTLQATSYTWVTVPDSGPDTTSHTLTNLTSGTTYVFVVRATNKNGTGQRSRQSASVQVTGPPPAPGAPVASPVYNGIRFTWNAVDAAPPVTRYEHKIHDHTQNAVAVDWTPSPNNTGPSFNVHDTTLRNGHSYSVRVRAVSEFGTGPASAASNRVTAGPLRPILEVTRIEPIGRGLRIHWREVAAANPAMTSLTVSAQPSDEAGETPGGSTITFDGEDPPTDIKQLEAGRQHTIWVRGANSNGNGAWSDAATGTPLPGPTVQFSENNPLNVNENDTFTLEVTTTRASGAKPFPVTLSADPPGAVGLGSRGSDSLQVQMTPPTHEITAVALGDADNENATVAITLTTTSDEYETGIPDRWTVYVQDTGDGTRRTVEFGNENPDRAAEAHPFTITVTATPPPGGDRGTPELQLTSDHTDKIGFGPRNRPTYKVKLTQAVTEIDAMAFRDDDEDDVHLTVELSVKGAGYTAGDRHELAIHVLDTPTPVPAIPVPLVWTLGALLAALGARRLRSRTPARR